MKIQYQIKQVFVPESKPRIIEYVFEDFSQDDILKLDNSIEILSHFSYIFSKLNAVNDSYNEFIEPCNIDNNNIHKQEIVERRSRSYLFEFTLYLDHFKKYISDFKGNNDEYLALYDSLRTNVYDNNIEYRLMFCFRNVVTHVTDIVSGSLIGEDNNYYDPLVDKYVLIKDKNVKKKDVDDLKSWPARTISLKSVFEKSYKLINGFHSKLISFEINESVRNSCLFIKNSYEKIKTINAIKWSIIYSSNNSLDVINVNGSINSTINNVKNGKDIEWRKMIDTANHILAILDYKKVETNGQN